MAVLTTTTARRGDVHYEILPQPTPTEPMYGPVTEVEHLRAVNQLLRTRLRWADRNLALYHRLVDGREAERARHRDQVADLEQRIHGLRRTLADILGRFTDRDRPQCGSPRARTLYVDSRTLAEWRGQLVDPDPDPDEQTGAAA